MHCKITLESGKEFIVIDRSEADSLIRDLNTNKAHGYETCQYQ